MSIDTKVKVNGDRVGTVHTSTPYLRRRGGLPL